MAHNTAQPSELVASATVPVPASIYSPFRMSAEISRPAEAVAVPSAPSLEHVFNSDATPICPIKQNRPSVFNSKVSEEVKVRDPEASGLDMLTMRLDVLEAAFRDVIDPKSTGTTPSHIRPVGTIPDYSEAGYTPEPTTVLTRIRNRFLQLFSACNCPQLRYRQWIVILVCCTVYIVFSWYLVKDWIESNGVPALTGHRLLRDSLESPRFLVLKSPGPNSVLQVDCFVVDNFTDVTFDAIPTLSVFKRMKECLLPVNEPQANEPRYDVRRLRMDVVTNEENCTPKVALYDPGGTEGRWISGPTVYDQGLEVWTRTYFSDIQYRVIEQALSGDPFYYINCKEQADCVLQGVISDAPTGSILLTWDNSSNGNCTSSGIYSVLPPTVTNGDLHGLTVGPCALPISLYHQSESRWNECYFEPISPKNTDQQILSSTKSPVVKDGNHEDSTISLAATSAVLLSMAMVSPTNHVRTEDRRNKVREEFHELKVPSDILSRMSTRSCRDVVRTVSTENDYCST
eukprot:Rmarinus@m.29510